MSTRGRYTLCTVFLIGMYLFTAVASAQDSPAGRTVTLADWQLRLPIIGVIVLLTLLITGLFFYFAARNIRRTAHQH